MSKSIKLLAAASLTSFLVVISASCSTSSLKSLRVYPPYVTTDLEFRPQLNVTAVYSRDKEFDITAASLYQSSNETIVTVTSDGIVLGMDAGSANITISYNDGKVTLDRVIPVTIEFGRDTATRSGYS